MTKNLNAFQMHSNTSRWNHPGAPRPMRIVRMFATARYGMTSNIIAGTPPLQHPPRAEPVQHDVGRHVAPQEVTRVEAGDPDQAKHEHSPLLVNGDKETRGPLQPKPSGQPPHPAMGHAGRGRLSPTGPPLTLRWKRPEHALARDDTSIGTTSRSNGPGLATVTSDHSGTASSGGRNGAGRESVSYLRSPASGVICVHGELAGNVGHAGRLR